MKYKLLVCLAILAIPGFISPVSCPAGGDTLVVGIKTYLNSLSTTESSTRQTLVLSHNWADTLVYRDPYHKRLVPCLAEAFRLVGQNTFEFTLRPGIRFHNGEPLTSEAVRFSMEVFRAEDSLSRKLFQSFSPVEVIDELTFRITSTLHPRPALEVLANMLFIYPPGYYKKVGKEAFGKKPKGTGPYRFVSWNNKNEILFHSNPDYFGAPKGLPKIPKLTIRTIPEQMLRIEALLKGEVDLLRGGSVSPEHLAFLEQSEGIAVKRADIIRNYFLTMDALGRSGVDFFKDPLVRRAVNHAINRERIARDILKGCAIVNYGAATPQHFGFEPDIRTYPYDPQRAREYLSRAGYPDGFGVDFYAFRDESDAEAIAEDLKAVGIDVRMNWLGGRWDLLFTKLKAGELPLALVTWGSYSIFDASAILNPYFLEGDPLCQGTSAEIDRALREAEKCGIEERRKMLLSKAQKAIAEEALWAPLYYGNSIAAMREDLKFQPFYDEIDRFFQASWSK